MENQENEVISPDVILNDTKELQNSISELVEVIQTEQETKAEEKEEEIIKNEKAETGLQDIQTVIQTTSESQTAILEGLSGLSGQMSSLANQMDSINTTMSVLVEKTEEQNNLIIEGSFTITLAIVIVVSIKVFIDQISKW